MIVQSQYTARKSDSGSSDSTNSLVTILGCCCTLGLFACWWLMWLCCVCCCVACCFFARCICVYVLNWLHCCSFHYHPPQIWDFRERERERESSKIITNRALRLHWHELPKHGLFRLYHWKEILSNQKVDQNVFMSDYSELNSMLNCCSVVQSFTTTLKVSYETSQTILDCLLFLAVRVVKYFLWLDDFSKSL